MRTVGDPLEITCRVDARLAPPTPKSKLTRKFEKDLCSIGPCTLSNILTFLRKEGCELLKSPEPQELTNVILEILQGFEKPPTMQKLGDPLGCDYQFYKPARKSKKTTPLPQRFHIRLFVFPQEFVLVTETETAPTDLSTGLIHIVEGRGILFNKPEHHIIRLLKLKKKPKKLRVKKGFWAFLKRIRRR